MQNFTFWQRWLLGVCAIMALFGVLMAFLSATPLFEVFNRQIDPAFWGAGDVDEPARQFQHWMYGVWGATIAGWGVMLAGIVHYPFRKKEKWAWNCLALGLLVWYMLDTGLSVFYGVYFNVLFNTALLILAGLPVLFTRKEFV